MSWVWEHIKQEPVGFQAVVQTGLALGIAFGMDISSEALGAIVAFSAALLSFLTRTQVTPLADPRTATGARLVPQSMDRPT